MPMDRKARICYPKGDYETIDLAEYLDLSSVYTDSNISRVLCVTNPHEQSSLHSKLQKIDTTRRRQEIDSAINMRTFATMQIFEKKLGLFPQDEEHLFDKDHIGSEHDERVESRRKLLPWIQRGLTTVNTIKKPETVKRMHTFHRTPMSDDEDLPESKLCDSTALVKAVNSPSSYVHSRSCNRSRDQHSSKHRYTLKDLQKHPELMYPKMKALLANDNDTRSEVFSSSNHERTQRYRMRHDRHTLKRYNPAIDQPVQKVLLKCAMYLPLSLRQDSQDQLELVTNASKRQVSRQAKLQQNQHLLRREQTMGDERWVKLHKSLRQTAHDHYWQKQSGLWVKVNKA